MRFCLAASLAGAAMPHIYTSKFDALVPETGAIFLDEVSQYLLSHSRSNPLHRRPNTA